MKQKTNPIQTIAVALFITLLAAACTNDEPDHPATGQTAPLTHINTRSGEGEGEKLTIGGVPILAGEVAFAIKEDANKDYQFVLAEYTETDGWLLDDDHSHIRLSTAAYQIENWYAMLLDANEWYIFMQAPKDNEVQATISGNPPAAGITLSLTPNTACIQIKLLGSYGEGELKRWGNPGGEAFAYFETDAYDTTADGTGIYYCPLYEPGNMTTANILATFLGQPGTPYADNFYTVNFPAPVTLEAGKRYTYTIRLAGGGQATVEGPVTIEPWGLADTTDAPLYNGRAISTYQELVDWCQSPDYDAPDYDYAFLTGDIDSGEPDITLVPWYTAGPPRTLDGRGYQLKNTGIGEVPAGCTLKNLLADEVICSLNRGTLIACGAQFAVVANPSASTGTSIGCLDYMCDPKTALQIRLPNNQLATAGHDYSWNIWQHPDGSYNKTTLVQRNATYEESNRGIHTAQDLVDFRDDWNTNAADVAGREAVIARWSENGGSGTDDIIRLHADIDISHIPDWEPIGNDNVRLRWFTGSFDGAGHTITGLRITGNWEMAGLFGNTSSSSCITRLHLAGVNIDYTTSNMAHAGALVGNNGSTITACSSTGNIKATSTNNNTFAGGLVGYNSSHVTYCHSSCHVQGSIDAYSFVGGLVGSNSGIINFCYATGTASAQNYASYTGGLVGSAGQNIYHSYATGDATATGNTLCIGSFAGGQSPGVFIAHCWAGGQPAGTTVGLNQSSENSDISTTPGACRDAVTAGNPINVAVITLNEATGKAIMDWIDVSPADVWDTNNPPGFN